MARTAILIIFALLVLFLLPLSSSINTQSRVSATNSTVPERVAWLDSTVGILPVGPERSPRAEPAVVPTGLPAPVGSASREQPAGARSWDEARGRLKQLGVVQFRLETWGQPLRYRFTCWVPLDGNPYITRQFQATAERDVEAAWKVIEQIEAWLARRAAAKSSEG